MVLFVTDPVAFWFEVFGFTEVVEKRGLMIGVPLVGASDVLVSTGVMLLVSVPVCLLLEVLN